jgi:hypothetical protein
VRMKNDKQREWKTSFIVDQIVSFVESNNNWIAGRILMWNLMQPECQIKMFDEAYVLAVKQLKHDLPYYHASKKGKRIGHKTLPLSERRKSWGSQELSPNENHIVGYLDKAYPNAAGDKVALEFKRLKELGVIKLVFRYGE